MCYCSNIDGLFEALESEHHSRRFFTDSSKPSLKAVLLKNGDEKPSIPLVNATALNKTHEILELILRLISYYAYKWNICGDLKVIGLLYGMKMSYIKHHCFLCVWDSRDDEQHYIKKDCLYMKRLFRNVYYLSCSIS